ncbi:hypothetical protein pb186bvf_008558 [Paramecium bursaria]
MEDTFISYISEDVSLFGVFDGHRGQEVAKFVEQHFQEELVKNYNFIHKDYSKALEETFLKMDDLMQTSQDIIAKKAQNIGWSANVCLIVGKDIYVANAGHSKALLCRNEENFDLSVDHTPSNQNEKARLVLAGFHNMEGKEDLFGEQFITRALGHFYQKSNKTKGKLEQLVIAVPEITKTEILAGDNFILMGTHGLFQTLLKSEILAYINDKILGKQITKELLAEAVEQLLDRLLAPDQKCKNQSQRDRASKPFQKQSLFSQISVNLSNNQQFLYEIFVQQPNLSIKINQSSKNAFTKIIIIEVRLQLSYKLYQTNNSDQFPVLCFIFYIRIRASYLLKREIYQFSDTDLILYGQLICSMIADNDFVDKTIIITAHTITGNKLQNMVIAVDQLITLFRRKSQINLINRKQNIFKKIIIHMGPYLSQPKREKETVTGEGKTVIFAGSEMQGWRNTMEDAHILKADIQEGISLFAVFDGHGGKEVAKYVEHHFQEELVKNANFLQKNYPKALEETFLKMDDMMQTPEGQNEINQIRGGGDEASYAGCTANVALIVGNDIYVANAGDSRSVLCRSGNNFDLSIDHKPDNQIEKDRIEKAGGFVSDGRVNGNLNLSRALGDLEYKRDNRLRKDEQLIIAVPEVKTTQLTANDSFLLMGCDGVFETLNHTELLAFVNEKISGKQITKELLANTVEQLLDRLLAPDTSNGTGCDNMTALLIFFKKN